VTLRADSSLTPVQLRSTAGFVRYTDGGLERSCVGQGVTATVFNTDTLHFKSNNPAGFNRVVVPAHFGPGAEQEFDGESEIETVLFLGTGGDEVTLLGTPGNDFVNVGGLFPTVVRWGVAGSTSDIDTDDDLIIGTGSTPGKLIVEGGAGRDVLTGRGHDALTPLISTSHPLVLRGGPGVDTLSDGLASSDSLVGGPDGDTLATNDGRGPDVVDGSEGSDFARVDVFDAFNSSTTEQVVILTVGTVRMTPVRMTGAEGRTAELDLSWKHPKTWRELRKVELRLAHGTETLGTVAVRPFGKRVTARGAVKVLPGGTLLRRRGKTVTAKLRVRLDASTAGKSLSVDVEAKDRKGRSQVEPNVGLVVVRKPR
jgi:hypothetical protein